MNINVHEMHKPPHEMRNHHWCLLISVLIYHIFPFDLLMLVKIFFYYKS